MGGVRRVRRIVGVLAAEEIRQWETGTEPTQEEHPRDHSPVCRAYAYFVRDCREHSGEIPGDKKRKRRPVEKQIGQAALDNNELLLCTMTLRFKFSRPEALFPIELGGQTVRETLWRCR